MSELSVICWLWRTPGYRTEFSAEHVNRLRAMVERYYPAPHTFRCVTNHPKGIDPRVVIVADTEDFAAVRSPHGGANPSCYRRLRAFHPNAAQWFGERFVCLDLDVLLVGDVRPLFDCADDFKIWQDPMHPKQGNGSMWLLRAGSRPFVWRHFYPESSPGIARAAGYAGSDQAWMSYCLPEAPRWTRADGVLSYRVDCNCGLPSGASVVSFHGSVKPWSSGSPAWARSPHLDPGPFALPRNPTQSTPANS